ncbi:RluA family pseudouridine synthase [Bdellovibrio bacteriovorus]|uniref:RNA pseudouridine synthase n=2 Tax=Bdellovibrio bacteriovorus TaxID=959 RepID=A0A1Z3N8V9_BDEBC|nr:RNA pseudouridine synthase [Bdellovibrio bacteriovorus]ASD63887.1 RNA pseudouridine synthase [Bdellovibrio bacteriovorus]
MIEILFEDDYFLAAAKPAGMPSQATVDKSRLDFFTSLKNQLRSERGNDFYLALHHRLDRDTSGVMIFAKSKEANEPLADLFKTHKIQKTYLCLTKRTQKAAEAWEVDNHLVEMKDNKLKKTKMVRTQSGGDRAYTKFRKLEVFPEALLIEAQPLTGRMHQIRVHLADRGMGIYGDDIYQAPKNPVAPRLMLHAHALEFTHPFTQEFVRIECAMPADMAQFMKTLTFHSKND